VIVPNALVLVALGLPFAFTSHPLSKFGKNWVRQCGYLLAQLALNVGGQFNLIMSLAHTAALL